MSEVKIYVGGVKFVTNTDILKRFPDTQLGEMKEGTYWFDDRNPEVFAKILNYYETGVLEKDDNVSMSEWNRGLYLWGIISRQTYEAKKEASYYHDLTGGQHILAWECTIL